MCKPSVNKMNIYRNGPCWFQVRSYSDACASFSLGQTWRQSLANVLRRWADKTEGVQSFTIVGKAPPQIVFSDVIDAIASGMTDATKYLNDLWRDRVFGSDERDAVAVLPMKITIPPV